MARTPGPHDGARTAAAVLRLRERGIVAAEAGNERCTLGMRLPPLPLRTPLDRFVRPLTVSCDPRPFHETLDRLVVYPPLCVCFGRFMRASTASCVLQPFRATFDRFVLRVTLDRFVHASTVSYVLQTKRFEPLDHFVHVLRPFRAWFVFGSIIYHSVSQYMDGFYIEI